MTVNLAYFLLEEVFVMENDRNGLKEKVFDYLLKSSPPSKVTVLSCKILLDRIPTRSNLARRQVIFLLSDSNDSSSSNANN